MLEASTETCLYGVVSVLTSLVLYCCLFVGESRSCQKSRGFGRRRFIQLLDFASLQIS